MATNLRRSNLVIDLLVPIPDETLSIASRPPTTNLIVPEQATPQLLQIQTKGHPGLVKVDGLTKKG